MPQNSICPRVGERFTALGGRKLGRIVSVEPETQLTWAVMGAVLSYVLAPQQRQTRLLMKLVMDTNSLVAVGVCVGDLVMVRRQLLNLKLLAERHHRGED